MAAHIAAVLALAVRVKPVRVRHDHQIPQVLFRSAIHQRQRLRRFSCLGVIQRVGSIRCQVLADGVAGLGFQAVQQYRPRFQGQAASGDGDGGIFCIAIQNRGALDHKAAALQINRTVAKIPALDPAILNDNLGSVSASHSE